MSSAIAQVASKQHIGRCLHHAHVSVKSSKFMISQRQFSVLLSQSFRCPSTRALTNARESSEFVVSSSRMLSRRSHSTNKQEGTADGPPPEFVSPGEGPELKGAEAIEALPTSVKLANYATAAGLLTFVAAVYFYSMHAVGGRQHSNSDPLATLHEEAQEARQMQAAKRSVSEQEAQELANLDMGVSDKELGGGDDDSSGLIVAVAAPDEVAEREEAANRAAVAAGAKDNKRPLWKKIVFFWQ